MQERNPQDHIFAVVRNPDSSEELKKLAGPNVHIIAGDLEQPETLHVRTSRRLPSGIDTEQDSSPLLPRLPRLPVDRWMSSLTTPPLPRQKGGNTPWPPSMRLMHRASPMLPDSNLPASARTTS